MPATRPVWSKDLATLHELQARSDAQALNQLLQLIEPTGISVTGDVERDRPGFGRSVGSLASIAGVLVVIALYVLIVWQISAVIR